MTHSTSTQPTRPGILLREYSGRRLLLLGLAVVGFGLASPGLSQTSDLPFPEAKPLPADEAFYRSQAIAAAKHSGIPAEVVLRTFEQSSFTTPAAFDTVLSHFGSSAAETHRDRTTDLDSLARSFLNDLDEHELSALARSVGSDLPGAAYREAFLAALSGNGLREVQYGLAAIQRPDGSLLGYYELHRPYLDVRSLRWIDETRIRTIRFPFGQ